MLPFALLVAAVAVPAAAFAFPAHSTGRVVLATGVFYWSLLLVGLAWMARMNYSLYTHVDGSMLRVLTVGGRRLLDLRRLDRMRSFSMWGQFGSAHTLRLHTGDGQHADVADERGRWWLGIGPRPSRLVSARHLVAMLGLYFLGILALLVVLVGYLAAALS
jgi:hypothetical protein